MIEEKNNKKLKYNKLANIIYTYFFLGFFIVTAFLLDDVIRKGKVEFVYILAYGPLLGSLISIRILLKFNREIEE